MKNNMNVIEIRGIRGIIITGCIICCLVAGFIVFPGWIFMNIWNYISKYALSTPSIGVLQGILLWGIVAVAYLAFKKDKFVVCFRSPKGLSDEELKSVFADLKEVSKEDLILKSMMKARETELKLKEQGNSKEQEDESLVAGSNDNSVQ